MLVQRVVFVEEIKTFGLSEREIREIAGKVVRSYAKRTHTEWGKLFELNDVRMPERDPRLMPTCQIAIECNGRFGNMPNFLMDRAKEIFTEIEQALQEYANFRKFLTVYNNCNGHNGHNGRNGSSETKEIMRRVGIPVIS